MNTGFTRDAVSVYKVESHQGKQSGFHKHTHLHTHTHKKHACTLMCTHKKKKSPSQVWCMSHPCTGHLAKAVVLDSQVSRTSHSPPQRFSLHMPQGDIPALQASAARPRSLKGTEAPECHLLSGDVTGLAQATASSPSMNTGYIGLGHLSPSSPGESLSPSRILSLCLPVSHLCLCLPILCSLCVSSPRTLPFLPSWHLWLRSDAASI